MSALMNINDSFFFNESNELVFKEDTSQSVNIVSLTITHSLILIEYKLFFVAEKKTIAL